MKQRNMRRLITYRRHYERESAMAITMTASLLLIRVCATANALDSAPPSDADRFKRWQKNYNIQNADLRVDLEQFHADFALQAKIEFIKLNMSIPDELDELNALTVLLSRPREAHGSATFERHLNASLDRALSLYRRKHRLELMKHGSRVHGTGLKGLNAVVQVFERRLAALSGELEAAKKEIDAGRQPRSRKKEHGKMWMEWSTLQDEIRDVKEMVMTLEQLEYDDYYFNIRNHFKQLVEEVALRPFSVDDLNKILGRLKTDYDQVVAIMKVLFEYLKGKTVDDMMLKINGHWYQSSGAKDDDE